MTERRVNQMVDRAVDALVLPPETSAKFSPNSAIVALGLCWFLGYLGFHRMYLGLWWTGLLMLAWLPGTVLVATVFPNAWVVVGYWAILGIWWVLDLFRLAFARLADHSGLPLRPLF